MEMKCFKFREDKNKVWVKEIKEWFVKWWRAIVLKKGGEEGNLGQAEVMYSFTWVGMAKALSAGNHIMLLRAKCQLAIPFL